MKVLQVATGFDVGYNGGITNYVRALSNNLVENGLQVVVLDSCRSSDTQYLFDRISLAKTKMRPFDFSCEIDNKDSVELANILHKISPDVIHVHMMLDLPYKVLEIFQEAAPTILSLHDYSWFCKRILYARNGVVCTGCEEGRKCLSCIGRFENIARFRNLLSWVPSSGHPKLYAYFQKIFSRFASVVAVSHKVKAIYEENGLTNNDFNVVHIGNVTANESYSGQFESKLCLAKRCDQVKIGFIGAFSPMKGADLIFELASRIPQNINIFGRSTPEYLEQIDKHENMSFRGSYTQADLSDIMRSIDIGLVMPTWEDNAPQVVFEFLNSKVPVIGSRIGGIPDFIRDMENGILVPPDSEGVEIAAKFLNNQDLPAVINGLMGRIRRTKTPEEHGNDLIKNYERVVGQ